MNVQKNDHGCRIAEFTDLYGKPCSIQESSLASEPAIWLGVDSGGGHNGRMHLSRAQVQDLLPILQHFVETGELPEVSPEKETLWLLGLREGASVVTAIKAIRDFGFNLHESRALLQKACDGQPQVLSWRMAGASGTTIHRVEALEKVALVEWRVS